MQHIGGPSYQRSSLEAGAEFPLHLRSRSTLSVSEVGPVNTQNKGPK
jgi:hypothetical protein